MRRLSLTGSLQAAEPDKGSAAFVFLRTQIVSRSDQVKEGGVT